MNTLGFGVGLRGRHFAHVLANWPEVDWFEAITENFLDSRGRARYVLDKIAERYPVALHGVSLSIGSADPIDFDYVGKLKALARDVRARWVSDHLCWTGVAGRNSHDLLPLPLNEETLAHVTSRVRAVQDALGCPIALENPSSYLAYQSDALSESAFLTALTQETGCLLLLDVNNVYVSSVNHGFDPVHYIESLPADRIAQIHLAGHSDQGTHLIDTHDAPVIEPVWRLFQLAWSRTSGAPTSIEWDSRIPDFEVLHAEALKAKRLVEQ